MTAPTDADCHRWGKLNEQRVGALVVVRGDKGADERAINIRRVDPEKSYQVTALIAGKELGTFTGRQRSDGGLKLKLPECGQEILELQ